ncbi:MAG TPA: hypothetical protein DIU08_10300, partial [Ktedonobacter sp.]|nr:hypothetical protein [Ktedonobacter sp.]
MFQTSSTTPLHEGKQQKSSLAFVSVGLVLGIIFCVALTSGVYFTLVTAFGRMTPPVAHAVQIARHVQLNLNIVINQPGMQKDWP